MVSIAQPPVSRASPLAGAAQAVLHVAQRQRRVARDPRRQRIGLRQQLGVGGDLADEADAQRLRARR